MTVNVRCGKELAGTLAARAVDGVSGIVTATRGKLRRLFCLDRTWLVFATSNLLEEQFLEVLVRTGTLKPAERVAILAEAARTQAAVSRVLAESGTLSAEILRRAMEGHIATLVSSCIEWPDGQVEFEAGAPQTDGEITARVSPIPLILRHARRHPAAIDALRVRIGTPDLRPVRRQEMAPLIDRMEFDAAGRFLLERCDGSVEMGKLVTSCPAGEEPTLRALYGLMLAGFLAPQERAAAQADRKEPDLKREEVVARVALADETDHYGVLGLDSKATRNTIRDVYYALARRYHPDRFRSGSLKDLLPRAETYFTRVTEAYNTLYSPERRAEYDQQIASARPEPAVRQSETAYVARQNYLRGKALLEKKRLMEAATFLENAVRLDATQAAYHLELGQLLAQIPRRREEAERQLRTAIEMDPANVAGYLAMGHLYNRAGRKAEAAKMFREVVRWDPDHAEASALLAETKKG